MPSNQFAGASFGSVRRVRLSSIKYGRQGFSFAHATESGNIGLREPAMMKISPAVSVKDAAGRMIVHMYEVEVVAKMLQSRCSVEFANLHALSKELHQLLVTAGNGDAFALVNNSSLTTPNGTAYVGCGWKFTLEREARNLEVTWKTRITQGEYDYMLGAIGTPDTGEVSGTALPLAAQSYTRTGFKIAGIDSITINGNSVGVIGEPKLEIEASGWATTREQTICNKHTIKGEVLVRQSAAVELLAATSAAENDYAVVINALAGDVFTLAGGSVSSVGEFNLGDEESFIKLAFEGETPNDTNGVTIASNAYTSNLIGY